MSLEEVDLEEQDSLKTIYSTEMALIMLADYLWWIWDGDNISILALLDLSVVFDTISCDILGGRRHCYSGSPSLSSSWGC